MKLKGTVTHIFAEKESGFKIIVIDVRDIESIEPDKRNPDFLGEMFGVMKLSDTWKGQYFTPYHIGRFMGDINSYGAESGLTTKEVITVSDCCCGSGCLLIAFANSLHIKKINFKKKVFFFAQDIDLTAALMCYIQLSLLGCMAVVKVGNSLSDPFVENEPISEKLWFTPMACFSMAF